MKYRNLLIICMVLMIVVLPVMGGEKGAINPTQTEPEPPTPEQPAHYIPFLQSVLFTKTTIAFSVNKPNVDLGFQKGFAPVKIPSLSNSETRYQFLKQAIIQFSGDKGELIIIRRRV